VTANAWLLVLEAAGFIGGAAAFLSPLPQPVPELIAGPLVWDQAHSALVKGVFFALLGTLALAAAAGMLRVRAGAWVLAMTVQGLNLFAALVLYFGSRPAYVYAMMAAGALMVLYLQQADVQAAFYTRDTAREARP
jgi:hypothetical protein